MGGIVKSLFGGSSNKSSSQSGNQAYNYLSGALQPAVSTGTGALSSIAALLGQGGDAGAANDAFNNYLGSTGYNFMLDQGSKAITNNAAAKGLLQSGATAKGLTQYGQNLGSQYFNNYLNQLGGLVTGGQNAANTIASAGQTSTATGKGSSSNGILPVLFG